MSSPLLSDLVWLIGPLFKLHNKTTRIKRPGSRFIKSVDTDISPSYDNCPIVE